MASAYPMAVIGLSFIHALAPQRGGILAMSQIAAPLLFPPLLALVPLAIARSWVWLRLALVGCALVAAARFGPELVSWPPVPGGGQLVTVASWNLEVGEPSPQSVRSVLAPAADLVALQELTPRIADDVVSDPDIRARYPHRVLVPEAGVLGMGVLSVHPILEHGSETGPALLWARVDIGNGRTVLVANGHPLPARFSTAPPLGIPVGFQPERRDAELVELRRRVDALRRDGEPLVLLGDYNLTDREPAYEGLSRGLRDAFLDAGGGWGGTWRPGRLEEIALGLLRIDYVFTSAELLPLRAGTDCTPRGSDHCVLTATLELR